VLDQEPRSQADPIQWGHTATLLRHDCSDDEPRSRARPSIGVLTVAVKSFLRLLRATLRAHAARVIVNPAYVKECWENPTVGCLNGRLRTVTNDGAPAGRAAVNERWNPADGAKSTLAASGGDRLTRGPSSSRHNLSDSDAGPRSSRRHSSGPIVLASWPRATAAHVAVALLGF